MNRAQEKRERQALFEARINDTPVQLTGSVAADSLLYRRVRASGRWIAERQFYVDNQIRGGRAGFSVITPLQFLPSINLAQMANTRPLTQRKTPPHELDVLCGTTSQLNGAGNALDLMTKK